jgi:hypothetical protein
MNNFYLVFYRPTLVIIESRLRLKEIYKNALDRKSRRKYAFIMDGLTHAWLNRTLKRSLPIMQNERFTKLMSFQLPRNNMLMLELNDIFNRFSSMGIRKHLDDYGIWFIFRNYYAEIEDTRRILSMTDLEFGFVLWLIACAVCLVCFLCELLPFKIKRKLEVLIALVDFLRVLRARMVHYHDNW